jgi:hypothetical protein
VLLAKYYLNIKIKMHEMDAACSMFPRILKENMTERENLEDLGRNGWGPVTGFCEDSNETSGSLKFLAFFDNLSNY